ncbi:hypothetical protein OH686_21245 [Pseudomonas sp. SO81]|nr:hypothetical protein OH686_21245 [Pseudomonas sp. SO81]
MDTSAARLFLYAAFCIPHPFVGPFDHGLTALRPWSQPRKGGTKNRRERFLTSPCDGPKGGRQGWRT